MYSTINSKIDHELEWNFRTDYENIPNLNERNKWKNDLFYVPTRQFLPGNG